MRLVVNVDDVGLHPAVQRAVEACAAEGIVTSASVLANGPYVRDARSLTGIGLGAHLNLLRGDPRWRDVLRDHHIELVHYGQCRV